ncbi:hypothetical protein [Lactiplantibacillus plantarum]|uniref:hypothetical protein n=1 Tax=Lactiplantibacillus plantarum TaxID=1590 RepID=UPI0023079F71|nr:hypothetical protein [Lactiplantibacillus plantarum]WCE44765.1 hypothetical protein PGB25_06985 [Lactiplantibacillus plantarum]
MNNQALQKVLIIGAGHNDIGREGQHDAAVTQMVRQFGVWALLLSSSITMLTPWRLKIGLLTRFIWNH